MIVKCAFCDGLMRVDHKRLTAGKKTKIRCPRCQRVGLVDGGSTAHVTRRPEPKIPGSTGLLPYSPEASSSFEAARDEELSEAAEEYLFPSEQNDFSYGRTAEGKGIRVFLWIMASLVVILGFAMFVNWVLPGPPR